MVDMLTIYVYNPTHQIVNMITICFINRAYFRGIGLTISTVPRQVIEFVRNQGYLAARP